MYKIIFTLLIAFPIFGHAQDSNLGNWIIYFGNVEINKKWNWHHEVQYRNYNFIGDLEQLLLRTGFGYNLSENNNNILLGYGYILSENYENGSSEKTSVSENRIYQQFITNQKFDRVSLQHRYRFEQRWIESDFKMRFRYFLLLKVAISNPTLVPKTFYVSAYNEIFLNTEPNVFDRNRLYGGAGYKISKLARVELGYLTQIFEKSFRDQLNMILFLNF
jgi:hypothetical protein